jgi:hypothetical protein
VNYGTWDFKYELEFGTSESTDKSETFLAGASEGLVTTKTESEQTTHTIDADLLMGPTDVTNKFKLDFQEEKSAEGSESEDFNYEFKIEHKRDVKNVDTVTTFEYKYELNTAKGEKDSTRHSYSIKEQLEYAEISFKTTLDYETNENESGNDNELKSDSELKYDPYEWLELESGFTWTKTQSDPSEESTDMEFFVEGKIQYDITASAAVEFGARQEWLWADSNDPESPGEDETTSGLDAKLTYTYAEVKATLELDYTTTKYSGDSDETEDYGFKLSVERQF